MIRKLALLGAAVALAGCSASVNSAISSSTPTPVATTAKPVPTVTAPTKAANAMVAGSWEIVSKITPASVDQGMLLTVRIRNNGATGTSIFTVTFLKGQQPVSSCEGATGSGSDQAAGTTATVQLVCSPDVKAGSYDSIAFQAT
jgi:hypothetical protein